MISITETARFRQRIIKYSEKKGVTAASIRFGVSRNTIYRWKSKYDGTWQNLKDRSHRPKSHPKQHTREEHDFGVVKKCAVKIHPKFDSLIYLLQSPQLPLIHFQHSVNVAEGALYNLD